MGFSGHLPTQVWYQVFRYLDGASLLAVTEADPRLQPIALHPNVLHSVTFSPDISEATLVTFFTGERRQHVRALRFTDCVALPSRVLLSCATMCENLRHLYIVNCAVDPTQLFEVLADKLHRLELLEWSLLEDRFYRSWIQDAAPVLGACHELEMMRHLRSMYVEVVATPLNAFLLEVILNIRCPELVNLHVHAIRKDVEAESSHVLLANIMSPRPGLETFTYTSERIPRPGNRAPHWPGGNEGPVRFLPEGAIWGNINYRLVHEANCSFVSLTDILEQKASLHEVRQATVVVEANTQVNCQLLAAASKPEFFNHVRSLTLALLPPREVLFTQAPTACQKYLYPLHLLFKNSCSAITELNLTSFHFTCDADGSFVIGSALRLLRELAISPCGVNHPDSLKFLARGCDFLEVLDVRTEQDSPSTSPCGSCRLPLVFTERCFERLHRRTRLRRLSVDETATLASFAFLRQCRVTELRLCTGATVYEGLGELLRSNPHLSVLTIEDRQLTLGRGLLAAELSNIHTLRRLCVLSGSPTVDRDASSFVEYIQFKLPRLEILHVHYLDVRETTRTTTWIRQRRVVTTRLTHNHCRKSLGVVYYLKPCVGCYTSTFIGLARPRNRN